MDQIESGLRPDVILSDIEMPNMNGFEFVEKLRASAQTKDIPVIMITSRTGDKHRQFADTIGVNHYLGKPYSEAELMFLLEEYTDIGQATA